MKSAGWVIGSIQKQHGDRAFALLREVSKAVAAMSGCVSHSYEDDDSGRVVGRSWSAEL